ncbi:MAG: hypothetical protein ACLPG2_09915, partial [Rhodoblastus sp.]
MTHTFGFEPSWRMGQLGGHADYSAWADEAAMTGLVGPAPASDPLLVETISLERLRRHESEWADLAGRALEPNVFMAPGFAG